MLEDFSSIRLPARTHPPAYSLHKYWARKPHNVVRRALEACGVKKGDLVVDPCCGSGVPLSEAARLGASCLGFDVNPVAVELTRTTLCPPAASEYRRALGALLDDLESDYGELFRVQGRTIRYVVHATVVDCSRCDARIPATEARRRGRTYTCPGCEARLSFNLENLVATRQLRVVLEDGSRIESPQASSDRCAAPPSPHDVEFAPNSRILAFSGMHTSDLFTPRTFTVLSEFASRIAKLPEALHPAARLTLTASVAQCSRLVAHRNDLRTGGPAWTVPGFWVPPLHLETNPLLHLRTRMKRFERGLTDLAALAGRSPHHRIHAGDARDVATKGLLGERQAALVFLDPPYGDSVPYLEFSSVWNSFLGSVPDPAQDIAVSDRARGDGTWENYRDGLGRIVASLRTALRDDGRFLVTFNNRDLRAWRALLDALQAADLRCEGAFYQHPAVVSTKAQLAPGGSYVGDIYCCFAPSSSPLGDGAVAGDAVQRALQAAPGADDGATRRVALLELLRANVAASHLDELPHRIAEARARSLV